MPPVFRRRFDRWAIGLVWQFPARGKISWKPVACFLPHADQIKVKSGRTVTIFNVCGNDFRLITAIHYDKQKVFVLNFLTHTEYSRNTWKNRL